MKGEHKRIVELAAGWEGSEAEVCVASCDAALLKSVGAPVSGDGTAKSPHKIKGVDLFAAAEKIRNSNVATPPGAMPTPNQQSVTGAGTDPGPQSASVATPEPEVEKPVAKKK